jgi:CDP-diglyceride synthetase
MKKPTWKHSVLGSIIVALLVIAGLTAYRYFYNDSALNSQEIIIEFLYFVILFFMTDILGRVVKGYMTRRNKRPH